MEQQSFDHVFMHWLLAEVDKLEERDLLVLAKEKGFNSITEWRLNTALRLGMDRKEWEMMPISNPNEFLPEVLIGPFQGWSKFFTNELNTRFIDALEIPEFYEWCSMHNRIPQIAGDFPKNSNIILYRRPDGRFIHIEGGHRMCAVAYAIKVGNPVDFTSRIVTAAVADISEGELEQLKAFLKQGTNKQ
jgi:hypothetical protein